MQISIWKIEIFPQNVNRTKKTQFEWKQDPLAHLEYGGKNIIEHKKQTIPG